MTAWRMARALVQLTKQVNAYAPHRRKDSDGGIGDENHAARTSDHNPYIKVGGIGVVRAFDYTHAPETGFDAYAFAEIIRKRQDPRLRYVISNRKIASGPAGPEAGKWRPYDGKNPHDHHTHVSVTEHEAEFDDSRPWQSDGIEAEITPNTNDYVTPPPTLRRGSRGLDVQRLQIVIGAAVDGYFGPETETMLKGFQRAHNLGADGVCGPQTWNLIAPKGKTT